MPPKQKKAPLKKGAVVDVRLEHNTSKGRLPVWVPARVMQFLGERFNRTEYEVEIYRTGELITVSDQRLRAAS